MERAVDDTRSAWDHIYADATPVNVSSSNHARPLRSFLQSRRFCPPTVEVFFPRQEARRCGMAGGTAGQTSRSPRMMTDEETALEPPRRWSRAGWTRHHTSPAREGGRPAA